MSEAKFSQPTPVRREDLEWMDRMLAWSRTVWMDAVCGIPIAVEPSTPPGSIEMRSGLQRDGVWLSGAANHDPGDEDRSER